MWELNEAKITKMTKLMNEAKMTKLTFKDGACMPHVKEGRVWAPRFEARALLERGTRASTGSLAESKSWK